MQFRFSHRGARLSADSGLHLCSRILDGLNSYSMHGQSARNRKASVGDAVPRPVVGSPRRPGTATWPPAGTSELPGCCQLHCSC